MHASVGDHLVIMGQHVGDHVREAEIIEVSHPDGSPPYLVRWNDSDHESLVFPGPDAHIEPAAP